jgi:hypothetical protein
MNDMIETKSVSMQHDYGAMQPRTQVHKRRERRDALQIKQSAKYFENEVLAFMNCGLR